MYQYEQPDRLVLINGNPAAEKMTGLKIDESRGKEFNELWPEAKKSGIFDSFLNVMKSGKIYQSEDLFYQDDLTEGIFQTLVFPIPGNKLGVAFQNVTARKHAEEANKTLAENSLQGLAIFQEDRIVYANKAMSDITGYTIDEILNISAEKLKEVIHPEDRAMEWKNMQDRIKGKEVHANYTFRIIRKDKQVRWVEVYATHIKFREKPADQVIYIDVTEQLNAREELKNSEERLKMLFEYAPDAYYLNDLKGNFIDGNQAAEKLIGYNREELVGKNFLKLNLLESNQLVKAAKILAKNVLGKPSGPDVLILTRKDGRKIDVEIRTYVVKILGKTRILGIARDITRRKKDEEKLKSLVSEKEILLKEVLHRVKNNFSVISSLLNLQSYKIKDKEAHDIFLQSRDRIQSMSLIHEKLYRSQDIGSIDFAEYIKTLAKNLYYSHIDDTSKIKLTTELANIYLAVDQAIPCGLIVNEILINTMKYAFPKNWESKGEINIILQEKKDKVELEISDNGIGMPKDFDKNQTDSLGINLITMLSEKQLDGQLKIKLENGTSFKLKFKKKKF